MLYYGNIELVVNFSVLKTNHICQTYIPNFTYPQRRHFGFWTNPLNSKLTGTITDFGCIDQSQRGPRTVSLVLLNSVP